jgi:hypothetical protein
MTGVYHDEAEKKFNQQAAWSATLAGSLHRQANPAAFAGYNPGILEMVPGSFIHNHALKSTCGAGEPDDAPVPGARNRGV